MTKIVRRLWLQVTALLGGPIAVRRRTPRSLIRLCRGLFDLGDEAWAYRLARRGLRRFPHSLELQDIVRHVYERRGDERLEALLAAVGENADIDSHRRVLSLLLDVGDFARAAETARGSLEKHPADAPLLILAGRVYQARFQRDHLASDGRAALDFFERALRADSNLAAARKGLAEVYASIGAPRKAMYHILLALDQAPRDEEILRLYRRVKGLPMERTSLDDLFREAEDHDQSRAEKLTRPADKAYLDEILSGSRLLANTRGVRRVALSHRQVELIARKGKLRRPAPEERDPLLSLAVGLRDAAARCTKRLGLGNVRQADLALPTGRVIAVSAGPTVLMVTMSKDEDAEPIATAARDLLASWTSAAYLKTEWVRT